MTENTNGFHSRASLKSKKYKRRTLIEGKFTTRYFFECHDITDANHPSELSTWERRPKDSKTILYWLANKVLDIIRHGAPGSKQTTYDIHPPMD